MRRDLLWKTKIGKFYKKSKIPKNISDMDKKDCHSGKDARIQVGGALLKG